MQYTYIKQLNKQNFVKINSNEDIIVTFFFIKSNTYCKSLNQHQYACSICLLSTQAINIIVEKKFEGKIPREFLIINAIDDKANTTNTNHMGTNYFL